MHQEREPPTSSWTDDQLLAGTQAHGRPRGIRAAIHVSEASYPAAQARSEIVPLTSGSDTHLDYAQALIPFEEGLALITPRWTSGLPTCQSVSVPTPKSPCVITPAIVSAHPLPR